MRTRADSSEAVLLEIEEFDIFHPESIRPWCNYSMRCLVTIPTRVTSSRLSNDKSSIDVAHIGFSINILFDLYACYPTVNCLNIPPNDSTHFTSDYGVPSIFVAKEVFIVSRKDWIIHTDWLTRVNSWLVPMEHAKTIVAS